jgi:cell division protein FtsB
MVSPLGPERASRGVFALVVTAVLVIGMVVILVINTSLAQGAFTISELQAQRATLTQQEQTLSEAIAAASAPEALEQQARSLGMVPSENPVFLRLPGGKVLGKPKAAGGATSVTPRLLTPADATAAEAVDNASVGTDLPIAPGPDYDPAAADAAAAQAAAANEAALAAQESAAEKKAADAKKATDEKNAADAKKPAKKPKNPNAENNLWEDATLIDLTGQLSSEDAGLVAVPVP